MKKVKHTIATISTSCIIIILLLSATSSFAQPPAGENFTPPSRMQENSADDIAAAETKWMKKNLKLKKDQAKKIKDINNRYAYKQQDYRKAMMPERSVTERPGTNTSTRSAGNQAAAGDENRKKVKEKFDLLSDEKDAELKKVLTEKQYADYLKKKPALQESLQNSNGNGSMPMPPPPQGGF